MTNFSGDVNALLELKDLNTEGSSYWKHLKLRNQK